MGFKPCEEEVNRPKDEQGAMIELMRCQQEASQMMLRRLKAIEEHLQAENPYVEVGM